MNKSLFALVFALPLLAACFGKKTEKNEVVTTEVVHHEEATTVPAESDEASDSREEVEIDEENDEK